VVGRGSSPDDVIEFFFSTLPNPSGHTMALGSTQPLTEMSTRRSLWGKARSARRTDNVTTIYDPSV
jgi:hypothetical protein